MNAMRRAEPLKLAHHGSGSPGSMWVVCRSGRVRGRLPRRRGCLRGGLRASVSERPASGRRMLRIAPTVHAAALKAATRSGVSLNKCAEQALPPLAEAPIVAHSAGPKPDRVARGFRRRLPLDGEA